MLALRKSAGIRCPNSITVVRSDGQSVIVRTYFTQGIEGMREYVDSIQPLVAAVSRGDVKSYDDLITRSRVPLR